MAHDSLLFQNFTSKCEHGLPHFREARRLRERQFVRGSHLDPGHRSPQPARQPARIFREAVKGVNGSIGFN